MSATDELVPLLKKLKLSGVLHTLDLRTRQAVEDELPYPEYIYRLLQDEVDRREGNQLHIRLKRAGFEQEKTLEDFDFTFNSNIPKTRLIDLATCRFIDRQENVLLVGPTGVGKSHVVQGLGHRACRAGYSTVFVSAHHMLSTLRAGRADDSWEKKMRKYTSPKLLIIDDLGLRPLAIDEPVDLYEVIRRRYERGATVMTSNRAVEEWYPLFGDGLLASAAMDRLLHHAHVITMEGKSYRNPSTKDGI